MIGFLSLLLFVYLVAHSDKLAVDSLRCLSEIVNLIVFFLSAEQQRLDEFLENARNEFKVQNKKRLLQNPSNRPCKTCKCHKLRH